MKMKFIDLHSQYKLIKSEVDKSIINILESGTYIMGPEIGILESKLADYVGTKYALTCSSGTDALLIALMAWGIGPNDVVFTTPFSFMATAEVIQLTGATTVFVDIDPKTFNIDPVKLEEAIERSIAKGKNTPKAIIPVDLFGLCADYEKIEAIATKYDILILEDAAQSFGAEYKGRRAGAFGDCAATSFYPAKPLGCYGDGGAIFTNDEKLYSLMQSIRVHGQGVDKYDNERIGINGRLDTIQAAVLIEKLKLFPKEIKERNKIAKKYTEKLADVVTTPYIPKGYSSVWAQYSVLAESTERRTQIMSYLKEHNIPTVIYYAKPLHLQMAFHPIGCSKGEMPVSEDISSRIFSLPMHPYLKDDEIDFISDMIHKA